MYACKRFMNQKANTYKRTCTCTTKHASSHRALDHAFPVGQCRRAGRQRATNQEEGNKLSTCHTHAHAHHWAKASWPAPLLEAILRHETQTFPQANRASIKQIKLLNRTGGANVRPGKQISGGEGGMGAVNQSGQKSKTNCIMPSHLISQS